MWFFDWFVTYFEQLRSYFQNLANSLNGVPALGPYLSYPFAWIASFFANLGTASRYASSWADGIPSGAAQIFGLIQGYISSTWSILTASGWDLFSRIRSSAESTWTVLTASGWGLFSQIRTYCTQTWSILSDTRASLWTYVRDLATSTWSVLSASGWDLFSQIQGYCTQTWSILSDTRASLWSWITSGTLQAWLTTWFAGMQTLVISWIQGALGYLITQGFLVLDRSWTSFTGSFTWLLDKLIVLVWDQAAHFAPALWSLLEQVLKNTQVPER